MYFRYWCISNMERIDSCVTYCRIYNYVLEPVQYIEKQRAERLDVFPPLS